MSDPKTTPALPAMGDVTYKGLSQYAYVAALFHAARATSDQAPVYAASEAFDHADAFFAELAKRTK